MKKISLWKKISFYFLYRKILLSNKKEFADTYNLRIDRVNRLYTVINIPEEAYGEPYNLRSSDINKLSEPLVIQASKQITDFLEKKGLVELYKIYDIQKVDKFSFLIVIGFSLFDTGKVARNLIIKVLPTILILSTLLYFYLRY